MSEQLLLLGRSSCSAVTSRCFQPSDIELSGRPASTHPPEPLARVCHCLQNNCSAPDAGHHMRLYGCSPPPHCSHQSFASSATLQQQTDAAQSRQRKRQRTPRPTERTLVLEPDINCRYYSLQSAVSTQRDRVRSDLLEVLKSDVIARPHTHSPQCAL